MRVMNRVAFVAKSRFAYDVKCHLAHWERGAIVSDCTNLSDKCKPTPIIDGHNFALLWMFSISNFLAQCFNKPSKLKKPKLRTRQITPKKTASLPIDSTIEHIRLYDQFYVA